MKLSEEKFKKMYIEFWKKSQDNYYLNIRREYHGEKVIAIIADVEDTEGGTLGSAMSSCKIEDITGERSKEIEQEVIARAIWYAFPTDKELFPDEK